MSFGGSLIRPEATGYVSAADFNTAVNAIDSGTYTWTEGGTYNNGLFVAAPNDVWLVSGERLYNRRVK